MAILRIKNANGAWEEIPAIVGPQGPQGPQGKPYVLTEQDRNTLVALLKQSLTTETWKFTLEDGTTIQKEVYSFD